MSRLIRIGLAALALLPLAGLARATVGVETSAIPTSPFELIVVEAKGCVYCAIVRRDILPFYESTERGKQVPMRFVDINELEASQLETTGPIDTVPTIVLFKDHKEIGRMTGYLGPDAFFHTVDRLISTSD